MVLEDRFIKSFKLKNQKIKAALEMYRQLTCKKKVKNKTKNSKKSKEAEVPAIIDFDRKTQFGASSQSLKCLSLFQLYRLFSQTI